MIIAYYEQEYSKRSTVDKFEIEPKQLREWISKKPELMKVTPYVQKLAPGAKSGPIPTKDCQLLYSSSESFYDYFLSLIANMDETAISFNMTNATTIEEKGTKTISIASTGHENSMFT
ncbi:8268_t:CDS:2, partial [Dentiscutata erythropus]